MKKFYRTPRLLLLPAETSLAKGIAEYYLRNREFLRAFEPQRDESFFTEETQRELFAFIWHPLYSRKRLSERLHLTMWCGDALSPAFWDTAWTRIICVRV